MKQILDARSCRHRSKTSKKCIKFKWLHSYSKAEMMLFGGLNNSAHTGRYTSYIPQNDLMIDVDTRTSQTRQAFEAAPHSHSGTRDVGFYRARAQPSRAL